MNRNLLVTLLGGVLFCSLGCQGTRYGFACDVLGTRESVSGEARADWAEKIFDPPNVYDGPWVSVPDDAKPGGVLVVSRGHDIRVLPITTWTTKKGELFYCTTTSDRQVYGKYETLADIRDSIAKRVGVEGAPVRTYPRRIYPRPVKTPAARPAAR